MARIVRRSRPSFSHLALATTLVAIVCCASCGQSKGDGFASSGSGGVSGCGADDGGSADGSLGNCLTCQNGDGSFGGDSGLAGMGGPPPGSSLPANIDDCGQNNPGKLSAATVTSLQKGGAVDAAMKWLYPYDATVFPGGILPPLLMWAPQAGGADGVYLHMKSQGYEYKGCFGANSLQQLRSEERRVGEEWRS